MGKSFKGNGYRDEDRKYGPEAEQFSAPREPLQWQEVHAMTVGSVRASVSEATGNRGNKLYSFILGRCKDEGRTSKFFQPRDLDDLLKLVEGVRAWLDAARGDAPAARVD